MKEIFEFIKVSERLKTELRHSWLSNGRKESVAEHSWRMSLMLMLLEEKLNVKFDMLKALKIAIVHDLVEIYAGDIPVFEVLNNVEKKNIKHKNELRAINRIVKELKSSFVANEIKDLWQEYELNSTIEAKIVKALDKLEAQLQHNQAGLNTWEQIEFELTFKLDKYTAFNSSLDELKALIVDDAISLYEEKNIDIKSYQH